MKTLSAALAAELALTITRPGYLVEIGFASPVRLSTMGDITWSGTTWLAADVKVSGISQDGKGANKAALALGNTDSTFGALVLNEGIADRPIRIWAIYAGATATPDAVQVFDGVGDGADISPDKVAVTLVEQSNMTLSAPRRFISKATGFSSLQPAGTKIAFNGELFILERK